MIEPILTRAGDAARVEDDSLLHGAFRDLHGPRLHGFALLVALGDRAAAADATTAVLAEGTGRARELRHPERAAAWLRARVVRRLRRRVGRAGAARSTRPEEAPHAALRPLGVSDALASALAALSITERAALVAADVERLDTIDIETVLGMSSRRSLTVVRSARRRYIAACDELDEPLDPGGGEIADRIAAVAGRIFAS